MIDPVIIKIIITFLQIVAILAALIFIAVARIGFDEMSGTAVILGIVGIVICSIFAAWGFQVVKPAEITPGETFDTSEHQPIVSLNAKDRTIGSVDFMLGSGSLKINGEPRYFFYKKAKGDLLTLDSIPAMGTYISEEDNPDPNIETITHKKKGDKKFFVLWPGMIENWTETEPDSFPTTDTIIHVPNGTVTIPNPFSAQVT